MAAEFTAVFQFGELLEGVELPLNEAVLQRMREQRVIGSVLFGVRPEFVAQAYKARFASEELALAHTTSMINAIDIRNPRYVAFGLVKCAVNGFEHYVSATVWGQNKEVLAQFQWRRPEVPAAALAARGVVAAAAPLV